MSELEFYRKMKLHSRRFSSAIGKRAIPQIAMRQMRRRIERCNRLIKIMRYTIRLKHSGQTLVSFNSFIDLLPKYKRHLMRDLKSIGIVISSRDATFPCTRYSSWINRVGAMKGGLVKAEKAFLYDRVYQTWLKTRTKYGSV